MSCMKVPNYIKQLLKQQRNAANVVIRNDILIHEWLRKNKIDNGTVLDVMLSQNSVVILTEPEEHEQCMLDYIERCEKQ